MASKADVEAGKAFVRLYVRDNDLSAGLAKAGKQLQSFGSTTSKAGLGVSAVGAGLMGVSATVLGPMAAAVQQFSDVGDSVQKMAARTGMAAEAVSELGHAAGLSGTDIGTLENGVRRMQQTIADAGAGVSTGVDALAALGLTVNDLAGLEPDKQLERIADSIATIEDPANRTAAAMDVFGKSGTQLIPLMADGAAGIQAMREQAASLGITMSGETADSAAALNDAMGTVMASVKALSLTIGAALAPAVTTVANFIFPLVGSVTRWIAQNKTLVTTIAAVALGVLAAGAAITTLGLTLAGVGAIISGAGVALGAMGTIIGVIISPIGLAVAGLVALTAALVAGAVVWARYTESGRLFVQFAMEGFAPILETAKATIGGISDALMGGDLMLAGKIAFAGLRLAALQGITLLGETIGGPLGEIVKGIGGLLMGGNIQEAWSAGLQFLVAGVTQFASYVVSIFAGIGTAVVDTWTRMTSNLSGILLDQLAASPLLSQLMSTVLGVDVAKEVERSKQLNAELQRKGLNAGGDPLAEAKQAAADTLALQGDAAKDAMNAFGDTLANIAAQQTVAVIDKIGGLAGDTGQALTQAEADFAALLADAQALKEQQAAAAADAIGAGAGGAGGAGGLAAAGSIIGTFSGAALGMLSGRTDVQQNILQALQQQVQLQQQQLQLDGQILGEMQMINVVA